MTSGLEWALVAVAAAVAAVVVEQAPATVQAEERHLEQQRGAADTLHHGEELETMCDSLDSSKW
jgi:hypothetical protein